MIFWQLFYTFFIIGLFSFGGGYGMLPLIQNEVVVHWNWISISKFADIVAVSQITPGPIAVNSATYIGYTVTGSIWGSVCATTGVCLPSLIVVVLLYVFLQKFKESVWVKNALKGLKIGVVGLVLAAAFVLMTPENFVDYKSWLICLVSFIACYKFDISAITLIATSVVVGIFLY